MKRLIAKEIINIPEVLYHATFNAYIPSIKEKGLITNSGNSNYEGMADSNAVYLATNEDVAESYAEAAEVDDEIYDSGIVVLTIDTSNLNKDLFEQDKNVILEDDEIPETIAYHGNIPSSEIEF